MGAVEFRERRSVEQVEEGADLAPKFGADGLLPCITSDARNGEVLMLGWMNAEALRLTIETGEAHYFSRARQVIWRKGAAVPVGQNAGQPLRMVELEKTFDPKQVYGEATNPTEL